LKKVIKYNLDTEIRLDKYLKEEIPDLSRTKIKKFIQEGIIKVDEYIVKPSYKLKINQIVSIDNDNIKTEKESLVPQKIKLNIIYEDSDIIVINKQSGLVVHPGVGNRDNTLLNGVLYHCSSLSNINKRPGVIHRLDKGTSGVIVFAKTDKAHYLIGEQFASRIVQKQYKAIVWGNFNKSGKLNGYLKRDPRNRLRFKFSKSKGRFSSSNFKLVANYKIPISLVDIFPKTGRTHQIRVHLSSLGNPILKDELYDGGEKIIESFHQKHRIYLKKVLKSIKRVALHAYRIEFLHPTLNKKMSFEAPIPDDFKKILEILNEYQ